MRTKIVNGYPIIKSETGYETRPVGVENCIVKGLAPITLVQAMLMGRLNGSRSDNEGKMKSVEEAYQVIANSLAIRAQHDDWSLIELKARVLRGNCSSMETLELTPQLGSQPISLGVDSAFAIDEAALFLRDELLRATGQRIWGLTFTLYPSGQFKIEYSYNRLEGYEETDELISGEEINQSLDQLRALKGTQQDK